MERTDRVHVVDQEADVESLGVAVFGALAALQDEYEAVPAAAPPCEL